ncbi:hypothetical protein CEXT_535621 [Caerostris extrusa]|uniref:Uncharacterized protein n=1 Tax=Caerostris extrusa TaxID=172846 RepID=A0AAV4XDH0_CAEEX|nr:hypothetical protein CEXT_535621 [Caerostris extrusa]
MATFSSRFKLLAPCRLHLNETLRNYSNRETVLFFPNSCTINPTFTGYFGKYSSLANNIRLLAYCRHFIVRCKLGTNHASEDLSLSQINEINSILFLMGSRNVSSGRTELFASHEYFITPQQNTPP